MVVLHLSNRAPAVEIADKPFDFSRATLAERWRGLSVGGPALAMNGTAHFSNNPRRGALSGSYGTRDRH